MSFKRFDPEDVVLSSELITFPTWYTQEEGDTSHVTMSAVVPKNEDQGPGIDFYTDYYSGYKSGSESSEPYRYNSTHSKALFSLAYAERPNRSGSYTPSPNPANIVFGQYRSLVLGDEDSEFRFGNTRIDADSGSTQGADAFMALTVDRARFREKLDPNTCTLNFKSSDIYVPSEATESVGETASIAPDTNSSRRYLDAGRVFDLALRVEEVSESTKTVRFVYPDIDGAKTSYGYFLPDIGVVLFNLSNSGSLFRSKDNSEDSALAWGSRKNKVETFLNKMDSIDLRSQETVTSNFVFVRARNAEFNYSTNPSNITGSAGNLRHDIMINQPQSFITTVGLYNDSNDLLAVAKLSRPLIKDFTKEALIRIKLDY